MPSDNEVLNVITGWSPKRPEKMSQGLEDWWNQTAPGSTHSTLKFDPDGIDDLLLRLKKAFPASPRPSEADFRAGGGIKTVQDLADALQPVVSDEAMAPPGQNLRGMPATDRSPVPGLRGERGEHDYPDRRGRCRSRWNA
jgi:hypothetical protein